MFKTPFFKKMFLLILERGRVRERNINLVANTHARDQTCYPGTCLWTGIQLETLQGAGSALTNVPQWSGQLELFKIQDCCIEINNYSTPGVTELKNCVNQDCKTIKRKLKKILTSGVGRVSLARYRKQRSQTKDG